MGTSRFFVANLPPNTKEQQLVTLFQDYGEVVSVELKTKENLVDSDNVKIIAFVTLKINECDVQYCIDELNWHKINGANVSVSLAKESFLERLKREREEAEAAAAAAGADKAFDSSEYVPETRYENLQNTRKTFSLDVDLDDDDVAPELMITKKSAASSLRNGKIVIENHDATPIHVIETKKPAKQLDAKAYTADQKRKESMQQKKNAYQQKKSAIQQALSQLDAPVSKKIKFSDDEEEVIEKPSEKVSKSKPNLFDGDDEDDDEDESLNLKPEHFGKKGEQLVQLQSKQSLDPRFRIDAKFVDIDEDEGEDEGSTNKDSNNLIDEDEERNWQLGILEQVVGTKIETGNAAQKAAKNKKMLRFDPAKDEHQKYLRPKETEEETIKEQKPKKNSKAAADLNENEEQQNTGPEVSKEVFYMVTDTLAQSLKTRGDGFSLLNMFGNSEDVQQRQEQLQKVSKEKILINKVGKNFELKPFSYDSSESEDDEVVQVESAKSETAEGSAKKPLGKNGKQKQKVKIVMESFFIGKNDDRLKEGANFFQCVKKPDTEENYEDVRKRLNLLIKTKISKTKKNLHGGAFKKNNKRIRNI